MGQSSRQGSVPHDTLFYSSGVCVCACTLSAPCIPSAPCVLSAPQPTSSPPQPPRKASLVSLPQVHIAQRQFLPHSLGGKIGLALGETGLVQSRSHMCLATLWGIFMTQEQERGNSGVDCNPQALFWHLPLFGSIKGSGVALGGTGFGYHLPVFPVFGQVDAPRPRHWI